MQEGVSGAATIMEFWTLEGYDIGVLIGVAVFVVRNILGGDLEAGSVLSTGSFENYCDGNLEGVSPGEVDTMGVS